MNHGYRDEPVTLQNTKASSVLDNAPSPRLNVFISGATANTRFLNVWTAGNPSNYQIFAWGFTDACGLGALSPPNLNPNTSDLSDKERFYRGPADVAPPRVQALNSFPVNTFAETAPGFFGGKLAGSFQIGPNRILLRPTWAPVYELPNPRKFARQIGGRAPVLIPVLEWLVPSLPRGWTRKR
jgi:hypothetical protein